MRFRLKAFALHLLASACVLTLVLGILYAGWYRWPGWYLAGALSVVLVLIGVDLTLGPLFTFIVARSTKPRVELMRDITIIATVQLAALVYGTVLLWSGRPLYYAFSVSQIQLVQAYDISAPDVAVARQQKVKLVPHWYSLPRWIWAPLPDDPTETRKIMSSVIRGGADITAMPRYFKDWQQGLPALRKRLQKLDDVAYLNKTQKQALKQKMSALGLDPNQVSLMPLTGRGGSLLAVFDPVRPEVRAIMETPATQSAGLSQWAVQRYWEKLLAHR